MKRLLFCLLLLSGILSSVAAYQDEPPTRAIEDLPVIDTANQIDMWGYGRPSITAWSAKEVTSWSADGGTLAVAFTAGILLYNTGDFDLEPGFLPPLAGTYTSVAFNPVINNQLLATDGAGGVWLWDIESGESTPFAAVEGGVRDARFTPDGSTISARTNAWFFAWDAATGELKQSLAINFSDGQSLFSYVIISDDGTKIAVSERGKPIAIHDLSTGTMTELPQPNPDDWFRPLAFSADNTQLFGDDYLGLYRITIETGEQITFTWTSDPPPGLEAGFVLNDGRLMTFEGSNYTGTHIRIWDDQLQLAAGVSFDRPLFWRGVSMSPDKSRIAAVPIQGVSNNISLMIFDGETMETVYESPVFPTISRLASSSVSLAYPLGEGAIILRDINSGEEIFMLNYEGSYASAMTMSEDGQRLGICADVGSGDLSFDPHVFAFDLNESYEAITLYTPYDTDVYVSCRWIIENGDYLTDVYAPTGVYSVRQGAFVFQYPAESYFNIDAAVVDDDVLWVSGEQIGVFAVDLATGDIEQKIEQNIIKEEGHIGYFASLSALHENMLAFVGGYHGQSVFIYDTDTEETLFSLDSESTVTVLTFSPDGSTLVTGHNDGSILRWDAATGELLGQIGRVPGEVSSVVFSPDATRLYSAGWDNVGRVWGLK